MESSSWTSFKTYQTQTQELQLFQKEVTYIGGIVSAEGYRINPKTPEPVEAL